MESKLYFFLFFIFILSLTLSSDEKEDKTQKFQPKTNILNLHDKNLHDDFQNTLNFVQPNADNLQSSNTPNVKIYTHFSDLLQTKDAENAKIPSDLLKTRETENPNIPVDLLNTHEDAESSNGSCELLNIKPHLFRYIFAYLSFFELEFNFKCVSTKIYNLYENFLQEEKNLLTKEHLSNKVSFLANLNYLRVYFDFFEKRVWTWPDRIEYANVDSFSKNLILFPKIIRQIVCFQFNKIEYKYVLFKDGHLSIFKKLNKEENFVFTSLENDFANFDSHSSTSFDKKYKLHSFQENIRWMEFHDISYEYHCTYFKIGVNLHKTNNFKQTIVHDEFFQKILICALSHKEGQKVFLKDITGFLQLEDNGTVTLFRLVKQKNEINSLRKLSNFMMNVKEIKSNDFEHYANNFQTFPRDVLFIFKK